MTGSLPLHLRVSPQGDVTRDRGDVRRDDVTEESPEHKSEVYPGEAAASASLGSLMQRPPEFFWKDKIWPALWDKSRSLWRRVTAACAEMGLGPAPPLPLHEHFLSQTHSPHQTSVCTKNSTPCLNPDMNENFPESLDHADLFFKLFTVHYFSLHFLLRTCVLCFIVLEVSYTSLRPIAHNHGFPLSVSKDHQYQIFLLQQRTAPPSCSCPSP